MNKITIIMPPIPPIYYSLLSMESSLRSIDYALHSISIVLALILVWEIVKYLTKVVIAVDNDEGYKALQEEIARLQAIIDEKNGYEDMDTKED